MGNSCFCVLRKHHEDTLDASEDAVPFSIEVSEDDDVESVDLRQAVFPVQ